MHKTVKAFFLALALTSAFCFGGTPAEYRDDGIPAGSAAATPTKGQVWVANGTNWIGLTVGTNGYVLTADSAEASGLKWAAAGGGGSGTVTSVATGNGLTGGPITNTGTIDLSLNASGGLSKTLGGGSNELGIAAGGIVNSHVNNAAAIGWTKISKTGSSFADFDTRSASDISSGTLAISRGGTGAGSASAAFDALSPLTTEGDLLYYTTTNARLAKGTALQQLRMNAGATAPEWFTPTTPAPVDATYITQTANGTLTNEQALSALSTGIVKNTTTTGVLSIAAAGTDYEVPLTFSTGLTRNTNTITVNTTQNIAKLSNLTGNGFVKTSGGDGTLSVDTNTYLTTAVTSVALALPTSIFDVSGSPVTTTGTLTATLDNQNANTVFAGPTNGAAAAPTFRSLVVADVPTLNQNTTGSAATLTTPRAIYGNNFDGSAALTQIIASTYGGTGNGFTKFSGPTTAERTFTLPDSDATLLYSGGPLGTPSSGTLTNATGLPISSGVSGLGANVATFLGTPSSANLINAVTDETGTGAAVFGTSPTIVTPTIAKLANLTSNGFVKTSGGDGTLSVDTTSYIAQSLLTTSGDIISRDGTGPIRVALGASGSTLVSNGSTPAWGQLNLASAQAVTGTLPLTNGGTGAATFTSGGVIYGNGTSALQVTAAPPDTGKVLGASGSVPAWRNFSGTSTKTGTYTVVAADANKVIKCDASGGAFTVDLTAAATLGDGFIVTIVKTNADTATSTNAVTIDANASETINGATTNRLQAQYAFVTLVCNGSNWDVMDAHDRVQITAASQTFGSSGAWFDAGGTSLALTPGTWMGNGFGQADFGSASTMANFVVGIFGTATGNDSAGLTLGTNRGSNPPPTSSYSSTVSIPDYKIAITSTTTYYCKINATYTGTAPQYHFRMSAVRIK